MRILLVFAVLYIPLMVVLGEVTHAQGRRLLQDAFGTGSPVAGAVSVLLRIGWYVTAAGLLFWNLGCDVGESAKQSFFGATVTARAKNAGMRSGLTGFFAAKTVTRGES